LFEQVKISQQLEQLAGHVAWGSGTVVAETDGLTSITRGPRTRPATGVMSRIKSKLSDSKSDALTVFAKAVAR
jgi:hypothetical protein